MTDKALRAGSVMAESSGEEQQPAQTQEAPTSTLTSSVMLGKSLPFRQPQGLHMRNADPSSPPHSVVLKNYCDVSANHLHRVWHTVSTQSKARLLNPYRGDFVSTWRGAVSTQSCSHQSCWVDCRVLKSGLRTFLVVQYLRIHLPTQET